MVSPRFGKFRQVPLFFLLFQTFCAPSFALFRTFGPSLQVCAFSGCVRLPRPPPQPVPLRAEHAAASQAQETRESVAEYYPPAAVTREIAPGVDSAIRCGRQLK